MVRRRLALGNVPVASTLDDLSVNKIKRAPVFITTIIECPECKAPIGERCITKSGSHSNKPHESRRRMAYRKHWADLDAERAANGGDDRGPCGGAA